MAMDDPWAVRNTVDIPDHGVTEPAHAFGAQLHGAPVERAGRGGALIYLTVGLFAVSAAMLVAILFMHVDQGSALYEYPGYYPGVVLAAGLLVSIGLLFARRTRLPATGIAFGTAFTYTAAHFMTFRPAEFQAQYQEYLTFRVTYDVAVALAMLGGILALIAGFKLRRTVERESLVRSRLVLGPIVALFGAGAWFAGYFVDQVTIHIGSFEPGAAQLPVESCCTFSQLNALSKVEIYVSAASVILLIMVAVISRSAVWSAGLFIGALLAFASQLVLSTLKFVAPVATVADDRRPQDWNAMPEISGTPDLGYWLTVGGMILFLVAAVLCFKLRPRAVAYGLPVVPTTPGPAPTVSIPEPQVSAETAAVPAASADPGASAD